MNENNNFFRKLIDKILAIFKKQEPKLLNEKNEISNNREYVLDIYNKLKNNEIDISEVDKDILNKIYLLQKEEIKIKYNKIKEKMKLIEFEINEARRYEFLCKKQ